MKNLARNLSRHLSKRDLVTLLEISWDKLSTSDESGIRAVVLYAVRDKDSTSLTSFSFSRHKGGIDERKKT